MEWDTLNTYRAILVWTENEQLKVSTRAEEYKIEAYDLDEAIRKLDKLLYKDGITGYEGDSFSDFGDHATSCDVFFSDSEKGLQVRYQIEKI